MSNFSSCCGLPYGQHRCYDTACNRQSKLYASIDELAAHVGLRGHNDTVHRLGEFFGERNARAGVAAAVSAEQQRGGDIFGDESGSFLALERRLAEAGDTVTTKKRRLTRREPSSDDDDDIDDKIENVNSEIVVAPAPSHGAASTSVVTLSQQQSFSVSTVVDAQSGVSDVAATSVSLAERIQLEARRKQSARRSTQKDEPKAPRSVWLGLCCVDGFIDRSSSKPSVICYVCKKVVKLNDVASSANMIQHYSSNHKDAHTWLSNNQKANSDSITAYLDSLVAAEAAAAKPEKPVDSYFSRLASLPPVSASSRKSKAPAPVSSGGKDNASDGDMTNDERLVRQRCAGILYAALTDTPLSQIGSSVHAGYISFIGGPRVDFSKTPLLGMLPNVFDAVCETTCVTSGVGNVGSMSIDGWTSANQTSVFGAVVAFVDSEWRLQAMPLGMLDIGAMYKNSDGLADVIRALLKGNPLVKDDFVVHTITSDNEASVAKAVEIETDRVSTLRCVLHTLALAVKDVLGDGAVGGGKVVAALVKHAHETAVFFHNHAKADALLTNDQLGQGVTADRVKTLKHDMPTRWYAKLAALEDYVALLPNLRRVYALLPQLEGERLVGPELFQSATAEVASQAILVLREVVVLAASSSLRRKSPRRAHRGCCGSCISRC
jgi:hypothetical protein